MKTIYCNRCGSGSALDALFCQRCGAMLAVLSEPPLTSATEAPRYAGFWIRVVAALIDFAVLLVVVFPVRMLVSSAFTYFAMDTPMHPGEFVRTRHWIRVILGVAISWAYRAGLESSRYQATLGKLVTGVKVTDLEGNRLSLEHATGRFLAKILSVLTLGIGYVMVGFDTQKRGLHDRVAQTLVQHRGNVP